MYQNLNLILIENGFKDSVIEGLKDSRFEEFSRRRIKWFNGVKLL